MDEISDEDLMEFADRRLSPGQHHRIAQRVEADPELQRRLAAFQATTADRLGSIYDGILDLSVPARLLQAIEQHPAVASSRAQHGSAIGGVSTVGARPKNARPKNVGPARYFANGWYGPGAMALAACMALVIGGAAGWIAADARRHQGELALGGVTRASQLAEVLEREPSVAVTGAVAKGAVKPVLSFRAVDGSYCREYRATDDRQYRFHGLACRQDAGRWRVLAHTAVGPAPGPAGQNGAPANRIQPAAGATALDGLVRQLMTGDAIGGEEEARLIARSWTSERN